MVLTWSSDMPERRVSDVSFSLSDRGEDESSVCILVGNCCTMPSCFSSCGAEWCTGWLRGRLYEFCSHGRVISKASSRFPK